MKKNECTVGFDTSNYTTSVAVCSYDGNILLNLKVPLSVKEGERGLRQSDAVFSHVKNQPQLMATLNAFLKNESLKPVAAGYSATPTHTEGSYMPCFLCGKAFALSFAAQSSLPQYPFSHQEGHIAAAVWSSTGSLELLEKPLIAFHVSGGTTDVILCTPSAHRLNTERIGGSLDLHAGQLIDRMGVRMEMPFPCGPHIEICAKGYAGVPLTPKISVDGFDCHLSGGENAAQKVLSEQGKEACCIYTLDMIANTLDRISFNLREKYPTLPIVYAGGVMSNRRICELLAKRDNTYFAVPAFSADNAAGIALLAQKRYTSLRGE